MSVISTDPIERFSVMHCFWAGQPAAETARTQEQAYRRFTEQTAVKDNPGARMIIVDSSEKPLAALKFFEELKDPRVTYHHIPVRPGREMSDPSLQEKFPSAYGWMNKDQDVYKLTIPSDDGWVKNYSTNGGDVFGIVEKYDKKFHAVLQTIKEQFLEASDEVTTPKPALPAYVLHDRPHLGSKRNYAFALAAKQGSQAVVYFDDDLYSPRYVESQLKALKDADFTALTQYPSVIYTVDMAKKGQEPVWAMTDLNRGGPGLKINWEGEIEKVKNVPEDMPMGFTYASRVPKLQDRDKHPQIPDILGGEDRGYLERLVRNNYRTNIQNDASTDIVRLVFGISSSDNYAHEILKAGDQKLPDIFMQRKAANHLAAIYEPLAAHAGNIVHTPPSGEGARERLTTGPRARPAYAS